ncbi:hypothetical protein [Mastigocoleus testarum]|uniref:Uncharacterized protein n=1 Tax=Mastigocoleus testarum BC008 TaxID=371196 RepID=A0A0V7ZLI1_9CYAN|nr:hypothetical protein [Mastigocoleus testarum]KST65135.1 hypothetical protein BC008_20265 [Mastigocoleus testarum BC008]
MKEYALQIDFSPSFHRSSKWTVSCLSSHAELTVVVKERFEESSLQRTFKLCSDRANHLFEVCYEILRHYSNDWSLIGFDGISAQGSFTSEAFSLDKFSFWSPERNEYPHNLVEALLGLVNLNSLKIDDKFTSYYEQLYSYFDFGIPVRIIEGNPKRLRIYCGLSSDMEEELSKIIRDIKPEEDLIVDMTNFDFMGTMLCPVFRPLIERPGSTRWIVSAEAIPYLEMMTVPMQIVQQTEG